MASTTIDTETELSAVNSVLGAIGQSPITQLKDPDTGTISNANPEVQFIYNLLRDANIEIQNEGWHFNVEKHVKYVPDSNNKIEIGTDILKIDVHDGWHKRDYNVIKRYESSDGKTYLYDKYDHTNLWDDVSELYLDIIRLIPFEGLPSVFQRHIIARTSRVAATQLVANPQLVQLLAQQEQLTRAACVEYECNQGNHSMFGFPEDTVYSTYQPWRNLRR
tara:strand:+ start:228 stop:887 length:660 start_codon:yes stop_codon:yes gene_type:complete